MIIRGEWKPKRKIPARRDLVKLLKLSPTTIQRAMEQLEVDGFISSDGARGTYVVQHLPNLTNYGILCPFRQM
jgi:DNA-binding GntR family transcriptional regulator